MKTDLRTDVQLYVRNLSKSTTETELKTLFTEVGEVTAIRIMRDQKSGESNGFGFITMSVQSEADKAVSRFNDYSLSNHSLKVTLAKSRAYTTNWHERS